MTSITSTSSTEDVQHDDYDYVTLRSRIGMERIETHLFTCSATDLWPIYLENLPEAQRQHYNCHSCQRFINTYGHIVRIDSIGQKSSAIWPHDVPRFFQKSVDAMNELIQASSVTGVWLSEQKTWGTPVTGDWTHFYTQAPSALVWKSKTQSASQAMAEKVEDYGILLRSLKEYRQGSIETAVTLVQSEALYRVEKVEGVAKWFLALHKAVYNERNAKRANNLVWLAVAGAPPGWCHVKNTMIGTILDDIQSGMSYQEVSRRFSEKMHPLKYMTPTAPPKEGNIARAEDLVKKLGIERSLHRRFAMLQELQLVWKPQATRSPTGIASGTSGVFAHLRPQQKEAAKMAISNKPMTWAKFYDIVLPTAEKIEFYVNRGNDHYCALTTALYSDAPPIFQWDSLNKRNTFAWYVYPGGTSASHWNLTPGWTEVTGICFQPNMWGNQVLEHQGKAAICVLKDCKDLFFRGKGNAIFASCVRSELHEVRSTLEAYSRNANLTGEREASANGIRLQAGSTWSHKFRVTIGGTVAEYTLDRWD